MDEVHYQILRDENNPLHPHPKYSIIRTYQSGRGQVYWEIAVPDAGNFGMAKTLVKLLNDDFDRRKIVEDSMLRDDDSNHV